MSVFVCSYVLVCCMCLYVACVYVLCVYVVCVRDLSRHWEGNDVKSLSFAEDWGSRFAKKVAGGSQGFQIFSGFSP